MDVTKWFIARIERPLLMYARGWTGHLTYERFFESRLNRSTEENLALQRKKLFEVMSHCVATVPYYRDIAKAQGISPSLETITDDLVKFPLLTKDLIRSHFDVLKSEKPGIGVYENTSGGSTGIPVKFLQDKRYGLSDPTLILNGFSGYRSGDRMVLLWGSERDILQGSIGWKNKLLNRILYRKRMFNSFRMTDSDMRGFVRQINNFKPTIMLAYVQSAYELARFIEREGLTVYKMSGIITSAGTLYPDFREEIEKVFGCPVFDRYGSREVGNMAMECAAHEGLHLNLFGQYIEILDDEGRPVSTGETGRIVVTSLTNYTMPLLRFEIGDLAVPSDRICTCGIGLPLIESVRGRTVNVFKTEDGALVDGEYFTHLFYEYNFIRQFQVVQEGICDIRVRYVLAGGKGQREDTLRAMEADMRKKIVFVMGQNCRVAFERPKEILPSPSGKYVFTISNI